MIYVPSAHVNKKCNVPYDVIKSLSSCILESLFSIASPRPQGNPPATLQLVRPACTPRLAGLFPFHPFGNAACSNCNRTLHHRGASAPRIDQYS